MKTSKHTEKILQTDEASRSSDKRLISIFLNDRGANLTDEQVEIIMSVNMESIRRTRQKLQSKGKYLGTPEVMATRRFKGAEVQQNIPTTNDVAELIERKPQYKLTTLDNGEEVMILE